MTADQFFLDHFERDAPRSPDNPLAIGTYCDVCGTRTATGGETPRPCPMCDEAS
jgi:rubrerythrin